MPKFFLRAPEKLVEQWPEVFEDMYLTSHMPINYLESIRLEFTSGSVWEINIKKTPSANHLISVSDLIDESFDDIDSELEYIDLQVNIKKLKRDIRKLSKLIL